MQKRKFSFSRYFPFSGQDEGSSMVHEGCFYSSQHQGVNKKYLKLVPLLDEEQLRRVPSNEDFWARRRSQLISVSNNDNMCPCMNFMFQEQLKEMQKIIQTRGLVDLSKACLIDNEQFSKSDQSLSSNIKFGGMYKHEIHFFSNSSNHVFRNIRSRLTRLTQ